MKNTVFVCLVALMSLLAVTARAQSCGNDSIYKSIKLYIRPFHMTRKN